MAKNRVSLVEQPPPADSTEEEVTEEEEEEEDDEENEEGESDSSSEEEDDDEEEENEPNQPLKQAMKKPVTDTVSGSESESEDEPVITPKKQPQLQLQQTTTKPVATNVIDKTPKKAAAKPSATLKRPAESDSDANDVKRGKKDDSEETPKKAAAAAAASASVSSGGEEIVKKMFQRLWSEDDEVVILDGIIDYASKKGENPVSDMDSFYGFIRKSIHIDVSKSQLLEKVRRLKKKYENNSKRGKQGGERTFSKPHEQKCYDLSKKIWGSDGVVTTLEQAKPNGTAKKTQRGGKIVTVVREESGGLFPEDDSKGKVNMETEPYPVGVTYPVGVVTVGDRIVEMHKLVSGDKFDEELMKEGLKLLEPAKATEFERKWKNLKLKELELHVKRTELVSEHARSILEAFKSKLG